MSCLLKHFLRYVKIDTQSDPESKTVPSTKKQLKLSKLLVKELKEIGLKVKEEKGYVYGFLPGEGGSVGFIAHIDVSPDAPSKVKPIVYKNYDGRKIISIDPHELKDKIGKTIITSDGTSLLGADDKAGIAEIICALKELKKKKHPNIYVAFTPDEEIGRSIKHFNLKYFKPKFAYTMDGGALGSLEYENFCASSGILTIKGVSVHPGYGKGILRNALKIASQIITKLPKKYSPERTWKKQPYIHPYKIEGTTEECKIYFIFRAFNEKELKKMENIVKRLAKGKGTIKIKQSYRNMYSIIKKHKYVIDIVKKAAKRINLKLKIKPVRGGTDGARLSFLGIPTPNIFAGGHNFHSKNEWVCLEDMEKAKELIIEICNVILEGKYGV